MGGGPSNTSSTTTSKLPPWAQPYASELLNTAGNYFPTVGMQPPQQNTAGFTPYQEKAFAKIGNQSGAAQGLANTGAGQLSDTLSGQYLNPATNPYLTATFNEGAQNVANQYNQITEPGLIAAGQQASGGGPQGAGGNATFDQLQSTNEYNLGTTLNNLATNIYGQNYANERQNQMGALGLLPQTTSNLFTPANELLAAGGQQQQQQQNVLNTQFANQTAGYQFPFTQLSNLGNVLGSAIGNTGSNVSIGPNPSASK